MVVQRVPKRRKAVNLAVALTSLLFLVCGPVSAQDYSENGDTMLWDGLEQRNHWSINTKGEISLNSEHKTEGQTSLEIKVAGNIPSQGVVLKKSNTDLDVTFARKMIVDVYNSGPPCELALAFYTDGIRESIPKRLESGMNKNVAFDIGVMDFRVPFGASNVAQHVMFILYPTDGEMGPMYFDNIRIKQYRGVESELPGISPGFLAAEEPIPPVESTDAGPYSIVSGYVPNNGAPVIPECDTSVIFGAGFIGLAFAIKKLKKTA